MIDENLPSLSRNNALAYLERHNVLTLATSGPQGLWAAAVFYASVGFDLIFLSAGHTRHAKNLVGNPRVAGTIQEDYRDWPEIQGIQLEGTVRLLAGEERKSAINRYEGKYPFLKTAELKIRSAMERVNWYYLKPESLYFIDNSRGFGHRDEIDLSAR